MISDLAYILKSRLPRWLGLLVLGSSAAFLLAFVDPIALKLLIDQGLGQKQLRLFIIVSVAFVSLAGLIALFRFLTGVWLQRLKNDLASDLYRRMLAAYYRLPYRQISAEGEGYFISRVYDEPRKAVDLVLDLSEQVLMRLTTILTSLGVALYLSWRVTVVLGGIVPILYWLSRKFGGRIMSESTVESEAEANFRHGLGRGLSAYVTIRSFDLEKPMTERSLIALDRFLSALYQRVRSTWIFRTFSGVSMSIAESAVLIIAAVDVFLGHMTVGGMLAYMTSFWKLINGATGLIEQLPDFSRARGYIGRLKDFESDAGVPIPAVSSQVVELRRLSFGYTDQQLFERLDLTIQPGHSTLLLGPNGCGKTTLGLILSGYLTIDCRYEAVSLPIPERISAMLSPLTFFLGTLRQHLQWASCGKSTRINPSRTSGAWKISCRRPWRGSVSA